MKKIFRLFLWCVLIFLVVTVALNVYVYAIGEKYVINSINDLPHEEVAIVLGAAVKQNGDLSGVLDDRVAAAIKLYKNGVVSKILVSGSNSTTTDNEVNPTRKVLVANGIPTEDIFLDHAGFDTYSTMYRAKAVFEVTDAIVVTQEFHLPRALYLARALGLNAYGFPADRGSYLTRNYVRELFARPEAFLEVITKHLPKYLGTVIPITGDGSST